MNLRMPAKYAPIADSLKAKLQSVAVPTLTAALSKKGYLTRFMVGLRPLNPNAARFCGPAWTLRAIPIREDLRTAVAQNEIADASCLALDAAPAGSVVVCGSGNNPHVALIGDIMATALMVRGVGGVVLDTAVADEHAISSMSLPVLATGSAPITASAAIMVVDHDTPIGIQRVAVFPGDIIVGDPNGAVCIPRYVAEEIADAAIEQEQLEEFVLRRISNGAPLRGTYPPDAALLEQYRTWRAKA
jgi:regulator of RNase E activity RraA